MLKEELSHPGTQEKRGLDLFNPHRFGPWTGQNSACGINRSRFTPKGKRLVRFSYPMRSHNKRHIRTQMAQSGNQLSHTEVDLNAMSLV
jgi:hypothetical protein